MKLYLNSRCVDPGTQVLALQYHCALIALHMEAAHFFETSVNFYPKKFISENFVKGLTFQNHLGTEICVISKIFRAPRGRGPQNF